MSGKQSVPKLFLQAVIILELLSWTVQAEWLNNYTLINMINNMNSSWVAGKNKLFIKRRVSRKSPKKSAIPTIPSRLVRTPDSFDARKRFTRCSGIISRIRNQGRCGSCWAVASVSVLSDRVCIGSRGAIRVHLSAEDVITCCRNCHVSQGGKSSCVEGAHTDDAFYFWMKEGIVTGGEVGSKEGCKPYSQDTYKSKALSCSKRCTNKNHWREYEEDKQRGEIIYHLDVNEEIIKSEIFTYGPVVCIVDVYRELYQYKTGVYRQLTGIQEDHHAFKMIGWGVENGTKYWLLANSWGDGWGMNGYMKIVRGENHCHVEQWVTGGRLSDSLPRRNTMRQTAVGAVNKGTLSLTGNNFPMYLVFGFVLRHCRNVVCQR